MASTEELEAQILAEMESNPEAYLMEPVNDILMIDPETRTINLPSSETLFGTYGECDVERKYFKCPKIVGDNIDLSKHRIYISYMSVKENNITSIPDTTPDMYYCEDMEVDGDYITFSWKLSGNVLKTPGFIGFAVVAKFVDGELLKTRWKTTPAVGTVLLTLPDGEAIEERYSDIIGQLLNRMDEVEAIATPEAMQGYVNEYLDENPPSGMTAEEKEQLQKNTEDISSLSEDLTEIDSIINSVNMVNSSTATVGEEWANSNGKLIALSGKSGRVRFNLVKVEPNETYTVAFLYGGARTIGDDRETLVSMSGTNNIYFESSPFTFTVGENVRYLALYGSETRKDTVMLVKGTTLPKNYIPYGILDIQTAEYNNLYGVKWCAFGDSLTDSATLANESSGIKNYVDYVAESLKLSVTNCGIGGTGYMKTENRFVNRVSAIPLDTEVLTAFGSFNDYEYIESSLGVFGDSGTDTIYGCMKSFFDSVFSRCPDIVVGVILPTKWGYLSPQKDSEASAKCDLYIKALIETAEYFNLPILDLYNHSNLRPWESAFAERYFKDDDADGVANTVHPLDEAHKKFIAPKIEAFIKQIYHVY